MKKFRKIIFIIITISVALLGTSCEAEKDNDSKTTAAAQKSSLVFYDSIRNFESTYVIVNKFNKINPNINVSTKYFVDGQYEENLAIALSSGENAPDCLYIENAGRVNQHAASGELANLNDYVRGSDLSISFYGTAIDSVMLEERLYALPRSKNAWMLFYNKEYFDVMGVQYPGQLSWEEFANLAKELTYEENFRKYWGGFIPPDAMNIGAVAAGEYLTDDELPITETFIDLLNRMYNVDESCPDIADMQPDFGEPYKLFKNGQIAMVISADWTISQLNADEKKYPLTFEWDIAPLPVFDFVEEGTSVGSGTYMGVSAFSDYPEAAFEFVSFYCGEQGAEIMAENNTCPAYLMDSTTQIYLSSVDIEGANYFFDANIVNQEIPHPEYEEIEEEFQSSFNLYFVDLISRNEALDRFYEKRNGLLQN